jgi:hypothetical protein
MAKAKNTAPYQPSPLTKGEAIDIRKTSIAPGQDTEGMPGQDVKQARGMNKGVGHSPNEAGTDQKVEDAKKARHNQRH